MFDEVRNNKIGSFFLMFFFIILIGGLGSILGIVWGNIYFGLIMAIIFGIIYSLIALNSGDKMILSMSGAKPATKKKLTPADIKVIDYRMIGATGRVYLSGEEANVRAAGEAAVAALEAIA